LLSKAEEKS